MRSFERQRPSGSALREVMLCCCPLQTVQGSPAGRRLERQNGDAAHRVRFASSRGVSVSCSKGILNSVFTSFD